MLIFTTIVVKITNPKSGLNLITNSSSPVLSAPSYYSTGARRYPLSYVYSGTYSWGVGDLYNQGSVGYGMSTTAQSDRGAYFLSVHSGGLVPQGNDSKTYSLPLRCVSIQARRYPLSYVLAGVYWFSDGILDGQGTYSIWRSSTAIDNDNAYGLSTNSSSLLPQNSNHKNYGFPLRQRRAQPNIFEFVFVLSSLSFICKRYALSVSCTIADQ